MNKYLALSVTSLTVVVSQPALAVVTGVPEVDQVIQSVVSIACPLVSLFTAFTLSNSESLHYVNRGGGNKNWKTILGMSALSIALFALPLLLFGQLSGWTILALVVTLSLIFKTILLP